MRLTSSLARNQSNQSSIHEMEMKHMKHSKNEHKKNNRRMSMQKMCVSCMRYWLGITWRSGKWFPFGCAGKTCKCKSTAACKHEGNCWMHSRCLNVYYENSDAGDKAMSTWAKKHFFYQKHMSDVKKVGWDKELQQDVVLPSNSKKFLEKLFKK